MHLVLDIFINLRIKSISKQMIFQQSTLMVYGVNGQAVSADPYVGWGQKLDNDPVPMVQQELTLIAQE